VDDSVTDSSMSCAVLRAQSALLPSAALSSPGLPKAIELSRQPLGEEQAPEHVTLFSEFVLSLVADRVPEVPHCNESGKGRRIASRREADERIRTADPFITS
jgi:hypothetical protein